MCRARLKDEFRLSDDVRGPIKDDVNLMIRRCSKVIANRRLPPFIYPPGGFFLNADHTRWKKLLGSVCECPTEAALSDGACLRRIRSRAEFFRQGLEHRCS